MRRRERHNPKNLESGVCESEGLASLFWFRGTNEGDFKYASVDGVKGKKGAQWSQTVTFEPLGTPVDVWIEFWSCIVPSVPDCLAGWCMHLDACGLSRQSTYRIWERDSKMIVMLPRTCSAQEHIALCRGSQVWVIGSGSAMLWWI